MALNDLKKALEGMTPNWGSIKHIQDLFSVFQKDNMVVPRKQLSELDTTQWLIEHEAEIQNHFQRPIIQLSRGQILGYFIDKELLEATLK